MKRVFAGLAALLLSGAANVHAADLPYAIPFNDNNEFTRIAADWAKAVAAETGGKVSFKLATNGALVSMPETLDALSNGVVPVAMGATSFMSGTIPAFGYVEMIGGLPLDNPPTEQAFNAIHPQLETLLAQHGVKPLWLAAGYGTSAACRSGFLTNVADWSGKKIRVAGRWQSQQVKALGASPIPLAPAEIYVGLQNGTLDCTLLTPSIYTSGALYEVAPYLTVLDLVGNAAITMMGQDVWKGLTDDQKKAVDRISKETTTKGNVQLREWKDKELEAIRQKKAQIHVITPEARAELMAKFRPIFDQVTNDTRDAQGKALIKALSAYR